MALALPANFKNDIQGKDTALVPVIVIGNFPHTVFVQDMNADWLRDSIIVSTNDYSWSYTVYPGDPDVEAFYTNNTIPTLLNVPSLKESIDIEKRNYKISNVNIDISNYEYNGKRFSELVSGSLINTECRIFWISPSTEWVSALDLNTTYLTDTSAFQVYFGTIRRYTHDDEKVKLVVEDRSQTTLHRDLPLPDNYLGTGDNVPDKYKNKPIPMVYGHVDKSPCVIQKTPTFEGNPTGEYEIIADNSINSTPQGDNPLMIYRDNYFNVLKNTGDGIVPIDLATIHGFGESVQYDLIDNKIIVYTKPAEETVDATAINPITSNYAAAYYNSPITSIKLFQGGGSGDGWDDGTNFISYPATALGQIVNIYNVTHIGDAGTLERVERRYKVSYSFIQPPEAILPESSTILQKYYAIYKGNYNFSATGIQQGSVNNSYIRVYYTAGDDDLAYGQHIQDILSTVDVGLTNIDWTWALGHINDWNNLNITIKANSESAAPTFGDISYYFNNISVDVYFMIDKFIESDFYANVTGQRGGTTPRAPDVIKSLLIDELGVDEGLLPTIDDAFLGVGTNNDYSGWKYAFTIDKKINSKKLLEGIASVSPYIPRFDNMGNFRFDVIKTAYQWAEVPDHFIKADMVISYKTSRTKIEDVKTRVELKYNWDYAKGGFNSNYIAPYGYIPYNPDRGYYGLPDDDTESTLIIDDDRGKYIRDDTTAGEFAIWMLRFYCNQHLKIKCRLPLSEGLSIEIGDICEFDSILDDVKPYGIDYSKDAEWEGDDGFMYYGDKVNDQQVYPDFMCVSTNKTLEYVEVELIQMHNLTSENTYSRIYGVDNTDAWNHGETTGGTFVDPDDYPDFFVNVPSMALIPPNSFPNLWDDPSLPEASGASSAFDAMFKQINVCPILASHEPYASTGLPELYASNYPEGEDGSILIDTDIGNFHYSVSIHIQLAHQMYDNFINGTSTLFPKLYSIHECVWQDVKEHIPVKFEPDYFGELFRKWSSQPWNAIISLSEEIYDGTQIVGYTPRYRSWWHSYYQSSTSPVHPWIYLQFGGQINSFLGTTYDSDTNQTTLELNYTFQIQQWDEASGAFDLEKITIEVLPKVYTWDNGGWSNVINVDPLIATTFVNTTNLGWASTFHIPGLIQSSYTGDYATQQYTNRIWAIMLKITIENEHMIENVIPFEIRFGTAPHPSYTGSFDFE